MMPTHFFKNKYFKFFLSIILSWIGIKGILMLTTEPISLKEVVMGWGLAFSYLILGLMVQTRSTGKNLPQFFLFAFGFNGLKCAAYFALVLFFSKKFDFSEPFIFSFFVAYFVFVLYDVVHIHDQSINISNVTSS